MVTIHSVPPRGIEGSSVFRCSLLSITLVCLALVSVCSGQVSVTTVHMDNARTDANVNETLLTPQNVNQNDFGFLFSDPIDNLSLAQPLYVPNVNINSAGTLHNVVYVATMADSLYAFDADNSGPPLWHVNFTNPANGVTTASGVYLPCSMGKTEGFTQEGIPGTPVIDASTGTIYLVVKTLENGTVVLRLHAIDITNGSEKFGGPVPIAATSTSNAGHVTVFNDLHQLNRPGLLFLPGDPGEVYIGFGSNGCNDDNSGWMLSYNATSLAQTGVFNTSPDNGLTSVWQTGNGPSADENGHIFVETGESCPSCFNLPQGGQTYSNSVIELTPTLAPENYFTPYYVAFLNANDLDLSASGTLVLPDQPGAYPHVLVAGGKQGFVYVLNRDNLGMYAPNDSQVLQEFPLIPGALTSVKKDVLFSSPAYWNNTVYFEPDGSPILAYPVSDGLLGTPLGTAQSYTGAHSPSISANGNTNGVLWAITGTNLAAFNATSMQLLYTSNQNKARDAMPAVAHFVNQIVANGKVYVATQTTLTVYGLFKSLTLTGGGNQSSPVLTSLPLPIQAQVTDPYSGVGLPGATVTFSDGGKGGTFNPGSVVSDVNGNVSTTYTFAKVAGIFTVTATSANAAGLSFTETALPLSPTKIVAYSGNKQSGQAGSILPSQLRVKIEDAYNNGVPGVTATFVDPSGSGTFNPSSAVTNASGLVQVSYQLPNTAKAYKLNASTAGMKSVQFTETATGSAPANLVVVSGNNQTGPVNTALPQPLVVQVNDSGGNPITGVSVVFSAPSGTFTGSPATSNSSGQVSVNYTPGTSAGAVTVTASVNGLNTQIAVTVTAGTPATVTIGTGNNQTATAGTTLPVALTVVVADQYGNPVSGVAVAYSDGGAGGSFSYANPVTTNASGTACQYYTLPPTPGTVGVSATAAGVATPAVFTETGQ